MLRLKTVFKNLIIKKRRGNITSLIFGQMFMFLLIVWCLFTLRLQILNTVFDYIDDALTTSLLGSALVNVEEYGKSNQLIIHDNEEYKDVANENNYSDIAKAILLSELNYGSDIILEEDALDSKQVLDIESRVATDTSSDYYDEYLRRAVSALIGNLNYNLSAGNTSVNKNNVGVNKYIPSVNAEQMNVNKVVTNDSSTSALAKSFMSQYVTDDGISIQRYEIISTYKLGLARRHIYQSEYYAYSDETHSNTTWDQVKTDVNEVDNNGKPIVKVVGWNTNEPLDDLSDASKIQDSTTKVPKFELRYKPFRYVIKAAYRDTTGNHFSKATYENILSQGKKYSDIYDEDTDTIKSDFTSYFELAEYEDYPTELLYYEQKELKYKHDLVFYNVNKGDYTKFQCFTDAQTTYQDSYETLAELKTDARTPYRFFYTYNGQSLDDRKLYTEADCVDKYKNANGFIKAPIAGYSKYSYTGTDDPNTIQQDDKHYMLGTTSFEYHEMPVNTYKIPFNTSEGSVDLEGTSLYVEIEFTIDTFPQMHTLQSYINTKRTVRLSRLIDIDINSND